MTTEQRLDRLEKWWRWAVCLGLVVGGGLAFTTLVSDDSATVVRAKYFHVVDDAGRTRAMLGVTDNNGSSLQMLDETGRLRMVIDASHQTGSRLTLNDESGRVGTALKVIRDQTGLLLRNDQWNRTARLSLTQAASELALTDQQGKKQVAVAARQDGPAIDFYDAHGHAHTAASVDTR